jgi:hypothetical protein
LLACAPSERESERVAALRTLVEASFINGEKAPVKTHVGRFERERMALGGGAAYHHNIIQFEYQS